MYNGKGVIIGLIKYYNNIIISTKQFIMVKGFVFT